MVSRTFVFAVSLLLVCGGAFAADPTADLLGATHVEHYIRLVKSLDPTDATIQLIYGAADSFDNGQLHSVKGKTFATDGEISIFIANFNPLTQVWTVESKSSTDPNYNAIKLFLEDLKPLQDSLADLPGGGGEIREGGAADAACKELRKLINDANLALKEPGLTAAQLRQIAEDATGLAGVLKAKRDLNEKITNIKTDNDAARAALNKIRDDFGTVEGKLPKMKCLAITSDVLVDYVALTGKAERIIASRAALSRSIAELIKTSLDPYAKAERWRAAPGTDEKDMKDLFFTTVTPTFENQMTVKASVKVNTFDIADDAIVVKTADSAVSAEFLVRRDSRWVTERAAAVIYNRLTYPNYGTKEENGKTLVKRTDDTRPVGGAMMLNLIPKLGRFSAAYPMLQIGVSSAKEFPGFLAGVGLRFTAPVAFSISAGGMITRYKDLDDNLKVDQEVSGTDEINKHLVWRTSPVALYGAIQMKF